MSLAPLLQSSLAIQIHAFAAMSAFALGVVQLSAPKGTIPHRVLGWTWVVLMTVVAVPAFCIHELRVLDSWSPIHLLAILTLVLLPPAVWRTRRHDVARRRRAMIALFTGALLVTGLLFPNRIMYQVIFSLAVC